MTAPHRFTWKGHRVLLIQEQITVGPVWVAWFDDPEDDRLFIRPALEGEHPHDIYCDVQRWIDAGLPIGAL